MNLEGLGLSNSTFVGILLVHILFYILLICLFAKFAERDPRVEFKGEPSIVGWKTQATLIAYVTFGTVFGYLLFIDDRTRKEIYDNRIIQKSVIFVCLVSCIIWPLIDLFYLPNIHEALRYRITMEEMERAYLKMPIIGYETTMQYYIHEAITDFFSSVAIAVYAYKFKWSDTKWYVKIRKGIGYFLLFALILSITNIHYFEWPELLPYAVIALSSYLLIKNYGNKKNLDIETEVKILNDLEETQSCECDSIEEPINNEPKNCEKEIVKNLYDVNKTNEMMEPRNFIFCPFCGKKIATESTFCMFCGEKVEINSINAKTSSYINKVKELLCLISKAIKTFFVKFLKPVLLIGNVCAFIYGAIGLMLGANVYGFTPSDSYDIDWQVEVSLPFLILMILLFAAYFYFNSKSKKIKSCRYKIFCNLALILMIIPSFIFLGNLDHVYSRYDYIHKEKIIYENLYSNDDNRRIQQLDILLSEVEAEPTFEECFNAIKRYDEDINLLEILKEESKKNNYLAQAYLGLYYYGASFRDPRFYSNVDKDSDRERAFYWFAKSAMGGNAMGQRYLGRFYAKTMEAPSVNKDLSLACKWWKLAAEQNDAIALRYLGFLYGTWEYIGGLRISESGETKKGVDFNNNHEIISEYNIPEDWQLDIELARQYWEKAAALGDEKAQEALEKIYPSEQKKQLGIE